MGTFSARPFTPLRSWHSSRCFATCSRDCMVTLTIKSSDRDTKRLCTVHPWRRSPVICDVMRKTPGRSAVAVAAGAHHRSLPAPAHPCHRGHDTTTAVMRLRSSGHVHVTMVNGSVMRSPQGCHPRGWPDCCRHHPGPPGRRRPPLCARRSRAAQSARSNLRPTNRWTCVSRAALIWAGR